MIKTPAAQTPKDRLALWLQLVLDSKDPKWRTKIIETLQIEQFETLDLNDKLGAIAEITGAQSLEVSTVTRVVNIAAGCRPSAKSRTLAGFLRYRDNRLFPIITEIATALGCSVTVDPDDPRTIELRAQIRFDKGSISSQKEGDDNARSTG